MNNKEFINALSERNNISVKETQRLIESLTEIMADNLSDGDNIAIQGFGTFEVKKKLERIIVNPNTKQRQLIPPKLSVALKPSNVLKDKFKK